jgi:hypothetical protein
MVRGYLAFDALHGRCFEQRAKDGKVITFDPLADLPLSWEDRINEATLIPGWQSRSAFRSSAFHVSASGCQAPCPPGLCQAMDLNFVDRDLWLASYTEEYEALLQENTMDIIDHEEYPRLHDKCDNSLPTMCLLSIKKDTQGRPVRAKYRIVVLGNLENRLVDHT